MEKTGLSAFAAACGGTLLGADGWIDSVVIDSRKTVPGALFAALKGDNTDGHRYLAGAFAAGAAACLVQDVPEQAPGPLICVPDVRAALQRAAAWYRSTLSLPVIAVTGSVGKTTAKEMLAAVLSTRFRVHKTEGNLNNELGVPLTLFGIDRRHTAAVVECGVSDFGEMTRLGTMVRPDIAVYTVIGDAHLEQFGDRQGVLRGKTELLAFLRPGGCAVMNGDDPLLAGFPCACEKLTFGLGADCTVRAEEVSVRGTEGTAFTLAAGDRRTRAFIPGFGRHLVSAGLAAAAVGLRLGLADEELCLGLGRYAPVGSRSRLIRGRDRLVIDDCYNANPSSVTNALASLARLDGVRTAILGDMLELGRESAAMHRQVGETAAALGIDRIIAVGPLAREIAGGAGDRALWYPDKAAFLSGWEQCVPAGTVLVKASHSMGFAEIVSAISGE